MYAGLTHTPCCLCGREDAATRIEVPPRALGLMENGDPISWRDVVGTVSLGFCESDWELVRDLVLDLGTHPLSRCNAAHVSLDLRADHEALFTATKEATDQTELEARRAERARETLAAAANESGSPEERALVEALVTLRALAELGVLDTADDIGSGTDANPAE
ncbi:hypothetical protein [Haloparvum sedimenti]|uniref:hypothetical protein n=1 Tax=Haloparvum sedimenti TaxID=1678448 RepID=UPI00071E6C34|nr:hypothetical protein [Haloparvum sedimenti]